jgi:hypothetical protein
LRVVDRGGEISKRTVPEIHCGLFHLTHFTVETTLERGRERDQMRGNNTEKKWKRRDRERGERTRVIARGERERERYERAMTNYYVIT